MTAAQPSMSISLKPRVGARLETYLLHYLLAHVRYYPVVGSWLQEDGIAMVKELTELIYLHCDTFSEQL